MSLKNPFFATKEEEEATGVQVTKNCTIERKKSQNKKFLHLAIFQKFVYLFHSFTSQQAQTDAPDDVDDKHTHASKHWN